MDLKIVEIKVKYILQENQSQILKNWLDRFNNSYTLYLSIY